MIPLPAPVRGAIAAWVLAATALVAVPGSAQAAARQAATLAAGKAICDAAVAHRDSTLSALIAQLGAAPHVTAPDKAILTEGLRAAIGGLQSLKVTFDADTALPQLRSDCKRIVTGFSVYLFLVPQAHLVVAADRVGSASAALTSLATLIGGRITAAAADGENVTAGQADVGALSTKVAAAERAAVGAETSLLALSAAGYPANKPTVERARAALGSAQGELSGALSAAESARAALKAG